MKSSINRIKLAYAFEVDFEGADFKSALETIRTHHQNDIRQGAYVTHMPILATAAREQHLVSVLSVAGQRLGVYEIDLMLGDARVAGPLQIVEPRGL